MAESGWIQITAAVMIQGKHNLDKGEVVEISGNKTSVDEFIRRIEAAKLLPAAAVPAQTQAAPGFAGIAGFLGLLTVRRMMNR